MLRVNSNLPALFALKGVTKANQAQGHAMTQLSTGRRVNQASDDVAGLAMSSKFSAQIRGYQQAQRNAQDGVNMLQTADDAAGNLQGLLFRMRDLAVQAANDTYSSADREALDLEFQELGDEIGRTLDKTQWNGHKLLDGSAGDSGTLSFLIGAQADHTASIEMSDLTTTALTDTRSIADPADALTALSSIDESIALLNTERARWAGSIRRLEHAGNHGAEAVIQNSGSRSTVVDTDYAQVTADLARQMILQQSGQAMLSQANQQPRIVIALLR
jgi:flagellin